MLRDTSPGAPCGAPASGSAHRLPVGRWLFIGAFCLVTGPLSAQTVRSDASKIFSSPCSSAKAVHDMRCSNYTGFKDRLGLRAGNSDRTALATPETALSSALRLGRSVQSGIASWYGPGFHGRQTASGETFDMGDLTAAHRTLPFGTRLLVQNPRTGKEVVVRINDRGPFTRGRVIDLSKAAAAALGIKARGHDAVVLREVQGPEEGEQLVRVD